MRWWKGNSPPGENALALIFSQIFYVHSPIVRVAYKAADEVFDNPVLEHLVAIPNRTAP